MKTLTYDEMNSLGDEVRALVETLDRGFLKDWKIYSLAWTINNLISVKVEDEDRFLKVFENALPMEGFSEIGTRKVFNLYMNHFRN